MKSTKRALLRVTRESLFFGRKSRETTTVKRESFLFLAKRIGRDIVAGDDNLVFFFKGDSKVCNG